MRVAVVDDNPIMQQIMVKTLHKYMHIKIHDEDVFTDGLSLLKALTLRRYDMILLDIEMPIMDGLQATLRIRNPGENPECASVRHNIKHSSATLGPSSFSSGSAHHRPTTPSPTVRQMRYALTSTGAGSTTEAVDNLAQNILEANRRVPIIAVTANAFLDQQRRHCLAVGMTDVVSKPIAPAQIMDIMRRYLDSEPEARVHLSIDDLADRLSRSSDQLMGKPAKRGDGGETAAGSGNRDGGGMNMGPPSRGAQGGTDHSLNTSASSRAVTDHPPPSSTRAAVSGAYRSHSPTSNGDEVAGNRSRRGSFGDNTAGTRSARTLWSTSTSSANLPQHVARTTASSGKSSLYKDAEEHGVAAHTADDQLENDRHRTNQQKGSLYHGSSAETSPQPARCPRATGKQKSSLYNDPDGADGGNDDHGERGVEESGSNRGSKPSQSKQDPRAKAKQQTSLYNDPDGDDAWDEAEKEVGEQNGLNFKRDASSATTRRPRSLYHDVDDEAIDDFPVTDELPAHHNHHHHQQQQQQPQHHHHPQQPVSTHLPQQTTDQKRASYRTFPLEEENEPAELPLRNNSTYSTGHSTPASARYSNASISSQRAANAEQLYAQLMSDHNADLQRESAASAASAATAAAAANGSSRSSRESSRLPSSQSPQSASASQMTLPLRFANGSTGSGTASPRAMSMASATDSSRPSLISAAAVAAARASISSAASHSDTTSNYSGEGERSPTTTLNRRSDSPTGDEAATGAAAAARGNPGPLQRGRVSQRSSLSTSTVVAGTSDRATDSSPTDVRRRHTTPASARTSSESPECSPTRTPSQPPAPPSSSAGTGGAGLIRRASTTRKR
ncbi:hypothetical protein HDU86_004691 [Geranomyces michiganensis]|nr:hypothetical protein HDU86_004691 [Geranomyces michiganensis]